MKKTICIWIVLAVLATFLLSATSCGAGDLPEDADLIARAAELIPMAEVFDNLFYVTGLPILEGGSEISGYLPVDMEKIKALGYEKLEDMLTALRGVWSEAYCQRLENSSLFSRVSTGGTIETKYCYDYYEIKTGKYQGIYVSNKGLPMQMDPVDYHLDTLQVVEKLEYTAKLSVNVTVTDYQDATRTKDQTVYITLTRGQSGSDPWMLDSTTAVKFFMPED